MKEYDVPAKIKPVMFGKKQEAKQQYDKLIKEIKKNINNGDILLPPVFIDSLKTLRHIDSLVERDADLILIAGSIHDPIMINDPITVEPSSFMRLGLPVVYWTYRGEPTFWAYSRKSFLEMFGGRVHVLEKDEDLKWIARCTAVVNYLKHSKMLLFGRNDVLPWGGEMGMEKLKSNLGILSKPYGLPELINRVNEISDKAAAAQFAKIKKDIAEIRIEEQNILKAVKMYMAIKEYIKQDYAQAFSVSCYGDLFGISKITPCLAGALLKAEGIPSTCDNDFVTLATEMILSYVFSAPSMMSNFYPMSLKENLKKHFTEKYQSIKFKKIKNTDNVICYVHSGHVAVMPPCMSITGKLSLSDWNGSGEGCTVDGEIKDSQPVTIAQLHTNLDSLIIAGGVHKETVRFSGMPFSRSVGFIELKDVDKFVKLGAREHWALIEGDNVGKLVDFAENYLNLKTVVF